MRRFLLFYLFMLLPYLVMSQYYVLGDDPAGIHWKQINTDHFQVIYPSLFEIKAQRMADILEKTSPFASITLKHKPSKISVVLHTNTVRSNGFVAWAPARMELFTTPHQEIYAQDWLEQLGIHEYRHVVQIDKIDSELPGLIKMLLGEQAAALFIGIYLPFWFLEGDAVVTETSLSQTGRGRVPAFEMELKAQSIGKGNYSYDKAYLGSYKDYVPDYYQLGYQIVAGVRNRYGAESWSKVLSHVASKPLSLNAFSKGLKMVTGKSQTELYDTIFSALKNTWTAQDKEVLSSHIETVTNTQHGYVSYRYPFSMSDSTFFAVKYSMDNLTSFIQIGPKGEEKRLFTPGYLFEESITFGHSKVFWIESKTDIRWTHREFSQLRILDVQKGTLVEKRYREKIFAPCLSPDGKHLAAIKIDQLNRCSILLLSPVTGEIEQETALSMDLFILTPSWSENSTELFAVALGNKGKTLAKINPYSGKITLLRPYTYNELRRPVQHENMLYYTASFNGTDDLFAYSLTQNSGYRVTNSRFGVRDVQPTLNGRNLVFSNYTSDGFKIVKMALQPSHFVEMDSIKSFHYKMADKLASQETGIVDFTSYDSTRYKSTTYSKLSHLFNFHSWAPVHIDLSTDEIRPGVSLMSQNKLSTALTQVGYDYSTINKSGKWLAEFTYTGLFPVFKVRAEYGNEKSEYFQINTYNNLLTHAVRKDTQQVNFAYKIMNLHGTMNIPLNLSHGKWSRLLQPEFQIGYRQIWQEVATPIASGNKAWLTYRLYAHNLLHTGVRDLQPAIGQVIDFNYHYSLANTSTSYPIWTMEGPIYLPGLVKHQGIRIYGGFQHKPTSGNSLSDYISYPRGYTNLLTNQLFCLKSDYMLPLFYPDWSIGRLSYIKRFSLRLFYDKAWATIPVLHQNGEYKLDFGSTGGELTADCNFLRLYLPAKIGFRSSYLIDQKKINLEFLLSINFGAL